MFWGVSAFPSFLGLSPISLYVCRARLPRWLRGKESARQCGRCGFDPWTRKIPWRSKWWPAPVFLPGKSHWQRSLVAYSGSSRKELDTTSRLNHSSIKRTLFIQSSTTGRLGCFHFLAVVMIAAVNTGVHVPVWTPAFSALACVSRSGIASSHDNSVWFSEKLPSCFPQHCTILHAHHQYTRIPVSLHPHQLWLLFLFLTIVIPVTEVPSYCSSVLNRPFVYLWRTASSSPLPILELGCCLLLSFKEFFMYFGY